MDPQTAIDALIDLIETRENLGDEEISEAWHGAAERVLTEYFGESSVHVRNFAEADSWRWQELPTRDRHRRGLERMRTEAADRAERVLGEAVYGIEFSLTSHGPLDDVSVDTYVWENVRGVLRVRNWVKLSKRCRAQ